MEEAHPAETREAPVALSAAEEAYLRRFVRRHALSGAAGKGLVASVIAALGLALWPAQVRERPASPQPSSPPGALAFAAELEVIRSEVTARSDRDVADAATQAAVTELAKRIEAIAREISTLRSRAEVVPAAPPARAPLPADTGVAGVAERLYHIELRQSQSESDRGKLQGQLLARLHDLETRQEKREREDASALRLLLDRVEQLEVSRDTVEAKRLNGQDAILDRLAALESRIETAPAAPQP